MYHGPGHLVFFLEPRCDFHVVVFAHHENAEPLLGKLLVEVLERGEFCDARGAPTGAQYDERRLALLLLEGGPAAVYVDGAEVPDTAGHFAERFHVGHVDADGDKQKCRQNDYSRDFIGLIPHFLQEFMFFSRTFKLYSAIWHTIFKIFSLKW